MTDRGVLPGSEFGVMVIEAGALGMCISLIFGASTTLYSAQVLLNCYALVSADCAARVANVL